MIDKRDRAAQFRIRLAQGMADGRLSQSALARATGVDRSTVSALLASGTRLPNAQLAADCAQALGVSTDWLLGLTDHPAPADRRLAQAVSMTQATRALFDATIFGWHREAAGYKVRHVPATLPDMLKTRSVVEWEYRDPLGPGADAAIAAFEDQLHWMRGARSDYEIAVPLHELSSFAAGSGYYTGLAPAARLAQIDHLIALADTLYPALRLYFFDAHKVFSAPVTVFGPHLAVVYLGQHHIVFRDPERVMQISQHFDSLVRASTTGAREAVGHLRGLRSMVADANPQN